MEQYDLEVRAVSKGRESYICDTTQGQLLLKEYKGSAERAEFLSAMRGHLGGQGLLTEQVVRTKEDAPIAVAEDETKYMVLTAVSGSECDTRNRADLPVIRLLRERLPVDYPLCCLKKMPWEVSASMKAVFPQKHCFIRLKCMILLNMHRNMPLKRRILHLIFLKLLPVKIRW